MHDIIVICHLGHMISKFHVMFYLLCDVLGMLDVLIHVRFLNIFSLVRYLYNLSCPKCKNPIDNDNSEWLQFRIILKFGFRDLPCCAIALSLVVMKWCILFLPHT